MMLPRRTPFGALAFAFASATVGGCRPDADPAALAGPGHAVAFADDRFSDWLPPVNLGSVVNSPALDFAPELSEDGLALYFTSNRAGGYGGTDLWVATRTGRSAPWSAPVNLGPVINTAGAEGAPHLSRDGHHLYFTSNRAGGYGDNDLWVATRTDLHDPLAWAPPENLGPAVNGPGFDAGAALRLPEFYFTSDRGNDVPLDIYVSRIIGGQLQPAVLVPELSSDGNDLRPSIRFDGRELVFSSDRAGSIDDSQDLWVATRQSPSGRWSTPVNLGAVVNSEYSDQQPALSANGTVLVFGSNRPGGSGAVDLYMSTRMAKGQ